MHFIIPDKSKCKYLLFMKILNISPFRFYDDFIIEEEYGRFINVLFKKLNKKIVLFIENEFYFKNLEFQGDMTELQWMHELIK